MLRELKRPIYVTACCLSLLPELVENAVYVTACCLSLLPATS